MVDIGLETECKHCRKCHWCTKYSHFDVTANTRTPVYYCHFPGGNWKQGKQEEPSLNNGCPYFQESYMDEEEGK